MIEMYLRTAQRKNKDGSIVRDPKTGMSVPHNIHNFARADQLDREALVRLCNSIARVCGAVVHDPLKTGDTPAADKAGLPDDVKLINTIEFGTAFVIETLWERLGIGEALRAAAKASGCKVPYERALQAASTSFPATTGP